MSKFYKELKELRESRKISLEEISERTKINVQYLQDIEKGSFEDIETPYLRLFLRAYAEEIGSDSQRALEQLDSYSGTTQAPLIQNSILNDNSNFDTKNTFSSGFISNKNHSAALKVIALILVIIGNSHSHMQSSEFQR